MILLKTRCNRLPPETIWKQSVRKRSTHVRASRRPPSPPSKHSVHGKATGVPTNLRGHHGDVVPGGVFSVQRPRGPYESAAFVDPEVPHSFLFAVQVVPIRRGKKKTI